MDTYTVVMMVISNILALFIGFMLGDEHHHETVEIADENEFTHHVQQAMWVSRRTPTN